MTSPPDSPLNACLVINLLQRQQGACLQVFTGSPLGLSLSAVTVATAMAIFLGEGVSH